MNKPATLIVSILAAVAAAAAEAQTTSPNPPAANPAPPGAGLSKGPVVHPGNPDPGMDVRPPAAGTMPVVPPPGAPGGDRKVVPK